MTQLQTLIDEIPKYQPGADLDLVNRAFRFSEKSHQGQQRASGEPYLSHPLEVAGLLVGVVTGTYSSVAAASLVMDWEMWTRARSRPSGKLQARAEGKKS